MATSLFIISNIKTTKEQILAKKEWYLKALTNLKLPNFLYPRVVSESPRVEEWIESKGKWKYEFPYYYDEQSKACVDGTNTREILYFSGSTAYGICIYEETILIDTIYKYSYIYNFNELYRDELNEFRSHLFKIISIFGGTEVIYLADNGCDKLSSYLSIKIEEGISYNQVKKEMINDGTIIKRDYLLLDYDSLNYRNTKEYVFDDLANLVK